MIRIKRVIILILFNPQRIMEIDACIENVLDVNNTILSVHYDLVKILLLFW